MKRFLIIAAAAIGLAACSERSAVEPEEARSQGLRKPGREERTASSVRVTGPFNEKGWSVMGLATSHGQVTVNGQIVYRINCKPAPATCFLVDDDGSGVTIWPAGGIVTQQDIDNSTASLLNYSSM